jgi:hypothetical protein
VHVSLKGEAINYTYTVAKEGLSPATTGTGNQSRVFETHNTTTLIQEIGKP